MLLVNTDLLLCGIWKHFFFLFIRSKLVIQTKSKYFWYVIPPLYIDISTAFSCIVSFQYWQAIQVTFPIRVANPYVIRVFSNVFFALLHFSVASIFVYFRDIQSLLLAVVFWNTQHCTKSEKKFFIVYCSMFTIMFEIKASFHKCYPYFIFCTVYNGLLLRKYLDKLNLYFIWTKEYLLSHMNVS
jgi:hypothetical protein